MVRAYALVSAEKEVLLGVGTVWRKKSLCFVAVTLIIRALR